MFLLNLPGEINGTWIVKYQSTENHFQKPTDDRWSLVDSFYEDNKYKIDYIGAIGDKRVFDIYVKSQNAHYELMVNHDDSNSDFVNFAKLLIAKFENEMINHTLINQNYISPMRKSDLHSVSSLTGTNRIEFATSWGVEDSSSAHLKASLDFSNFFHDYNDYSIEKFQVSGLTIVIPFEILNPPINSAKITVDSVIQDGRHVDIGKSEYPATLSHEANLGQEWFRPLLQIASTIGGAGSIATSGLSSIFMSQWQTAADITNWATSDVSQKQNSFIINLDNVFNDVKKIDIDMTWKLTAKSSSIFGNISRVQLLDASAMYHVDSAIDIYRS